MKLNKEKVYSLEDLTGEELNQLLNYMHKNHGWTDNDIHTDLFYKEGVGWMYNKLKKVSNMTNAKELFYTLENIQVDCTELTGGQIYEMFELVRNKGFQTRIDALKTVEYFVFFRQEITGYKFGILEEVSEKTTITYEKFMELFAEPKHEATEKPKHYSKGIDTFSRMEANCTKEECLAFAKGNIDKYNWREKGQDLEDYKKIVSYANWAIKLLKDEK